MKTPDLRHTLLPGLWALFSRCSASDFARTAGKAQQLQAAARRLPGLRQLDGRFMVIQQAMGLPKGRDDGARHVAAFVEEMKASGFVAAALARHKIESALVAPPQR